MVQTFWRRTGLIAFANAAALGLQFLTTILIAREFGASAQMDAYTLAVSIPEALQYVLMLATLSFVFTPLFIDERLQQGENEAWSIAFTLLLLVCGFVLLLIPLLFLAMPALMFALAPGFAPDTRALAVELGDLILPGLFYYATAGLLLGICYAYDDFTTAALNTLLVAVLNLAAFFFLVQFLQWGVRGLMLGRLLALGALEIFLLARALRFKPPRVEKIRWRNRHAWRVLTYLPPYMFGALAWQVQLLISRSLLSTLGAGSVAAWGYGQRLSDIPMAVLGGAIGTTFLPSFAKHVSDRDNRQASASWNHALVRVSLLLAPLAGFLTALAVPLITVLLQRGSFDERSTQATALVLMGLALGLPARGIGGLITRGLPAFPSRLLPILLSGIAMALTIAFLFALIGALGLLGVALATSIGEVFYAAAGTFIFARWLHSNFLFTLRVLAKIFVAAVFIFLIGVAVVSLVSDPLLQLVIAGALSFCAYALFAYALNLPETRAVQQIVSNASQKCSTMLKGLK